MNADNARAIFDNVAKNTTDKDAKARIEILREYFCNPEFRAWLHGFAWEANKK